MPRECSICKHASRDQIERWLIDKLPFRYLAVEFSVSTGALQRHKKNHLLPFQPPAPADVFQDYNETEFVRQSRLPPIPRQPEPITGGANITELVNKPPSVPDLNRLLAESDRELINKFHMPEPVEIGRASCRERV